MTSQSLSRKRPAPGTSPVVQPQMNPLPNFPPSNPNPQLSNDQFLQWGQHAPTAIGNPPSFADSTSYAVPPFPSTNDVPAGIPATAPNQLARRQAPSQLISRNRGYEHHPSGFSDQGSGSENDGGWGESLDHLYKRALAAKMDAQAKRKQIPPFVQKLSSFLDESKNTDLIRWSDDGNSFIVLDEDEFARTLIPELFKHNNYASFVRQLNMYGFHKKVGLSDNSMRASERKNKSPSEYANPYFKRGHPDLLWLIQKPKNTGQATRSAKASRVKWEDGEEHEADDYGEEVTRDDQGRPRQLSLIHDNLLPKEQFAGVYRELQAIRQQQQIISNTIGKLRREHEQLYAQAANFQEQHSRHENSINAILTFLATVYNRSLQGQDGTQNIANSVAGVISQDQGQGNVVDVGDDFLLSGLGSNMNSPNMNGSNLSSPNMTSPNAQRSKKQPLLLKAPPGYKPASAHSPSGSASFDHPQTQPHTQQPNLAATGNVEEVFDNSPRQQSVPNDLVQTERFPQRDIMSVIQNSNAQSGVSPNPTDFPNVLSSLETSGGNVPLTQNQRDDLLRLMANETNTADPNVSASPNNALVNPNPPPMPQNYSGRLANTRAEIDNLAKMQAEQDRSVQNLTDLLQPLSPTGSIPGLSINDANDLFDFDRLPTDGDYFGGTNSQQQQQQQSPAFFGDFDGTGFDAPPKTENGGSDSTGNNNNLDTGRVIETLTDSEATSPSNTVIENSPQMSSSGLNDYQGSKGSNGDVKRRRFS